MGFFSKFGIRLRREKSGPSVSILREGETQDAVAMLYPGVDPMRVATVYRCVRLLRDSVANLPLQSMRRRGDIYVDEYDSDLSYMLNISPDGVLNAYDFWTQLVDEMLNEGNAYVVPEYGNGRVTRLTLCRRHTVDHDELRDIYRVHDSFNGIEDTFRESDIIHVKGMTAGSPKHGVSVLTYARLTANIAGIGDRETKKRFAKGGNVRGFISNDTSVRGYGEYQDRELNAAANEINKKINIDGEHIVSLPGQAQWQGVSMSSVDMQFLETRKFEVREICRFFGVHPSFVYDDTSNNYKSAEMANVAFLSSTLSPMLRNIETEFNRKLFGRESYGKRRIQFDRRGLYACDMDSRVRYQAQTIGAGIYTVNDWRRAENQPPVEGGDRVLVSANLRGIDETVNGQNTDNGEKQEQHGPDEP